MAKRRHKTAIPSHSSASRRVKDQIAESHINKSHRLKTYYARQTGGAEPYKETKTTTQRKKTQRAKTGTAKSGRKSNYQKRQQRYFEKKQQRVDRTKKSNEDIQSELTETIDLEEQSQPIEEGDWEERRRLLDESQRKMADLEPTATPYIGEMILDKVYGMIDDVKKSGAGWAGRYLKQLLDETIEVWGKDVVARAIGQFPQEFLAEAETIVQDSDGNRVEYALTKLQTIIEGAIPSAEENKELMDEADKDAQYNVPT